MNSFVTMQIVLALVTERQTHSTYSRDILLSFKSYSVTAAESQYHTLLLQDSKTVSVPLKMVLIHDVCFQ